MTAMGERAPDKTRHRSRRRHLVVVAVTADAPIFELSIPCEVFGRARPGLPDLGYIVRVCNPPEHAVKAVHASAAFLADTADTYDLFAEADTVIVPAVGDVYEEPSAELVAAVKDAHSRGARIASLCSGAFVLAAAWLLDGRAATTHWLYAEELARRHPAVLVDPGVLYVDHGDVLTSAGSTAGIDLCLAMVAADHGATVANRLARRLVAPAQRGGGQTQYVETPTPAEPDHSLAPLLDWMREHLAEPLTVAALARHAHVAERTLTRRFHAATGTTPIKWLTAQRVRHACTLLEGSALSIDRVAQSSGFGGAANLRHHFTAAAGVAPSAYRRSFRRSG